MSEFYHYKVTLSYKGTHYRGWQKQTNNKETIQNYVEEVLQNINNYKKFKLIVAGRTDAGVHANAQVFKVSLTTHISSENLIKGMNTKLPNDIRVIKCQTVDQEFNPNLDAKIKEYHYYFTDKPCNNAHLNEIIYFLNKPINIEAMKNACSLFIGDHNFNSFSVKTKTLNTRREILYCSIHQISLSPFADKIYHLKIQSRGYLTYMVRFIMGALIDIGSNEISPEEISHSLNTGEILTQRHKAPAHGLHLFKINY